MTNRKKSASRKEADGASPSPASNLKHALKYASLGLPVVAVHGVADGVCSCSKCKDCKRPGKHPATRHGVKDATTNKKKITRMFAPNPNANVGIAVGRDAGILALDVDPRNGGNETFAELEQTLGQLPDTVMALSGGGGYHLLFQHPDFPVRKDSSGATFGPGIDVLTDDSIMIAAPSRHISGETYRWLEDATWRNWELALLPQTWLDRLRGTTAPAPEVRSGDPVIVEGSRNNHLTRLAGTMRRHGATVGEILAKLTQENAKSCSPPLDDDEVAKIAESVSRYAPVQGEPADPADALMQRTLDLHFAAGRHLLYTGHQFWHYDGGLWSGVPEPWVQGKVLETLSAHPVSGQRSASLMTQAVALLKAKLAPKDDVLGFVSDQRPIINCRNGELWIAPDGSAELRAHQPESHLRHRLDVDYDPAAQCPQYDKAVLEIFANSGKPKSMVQHWNEFLGYTIQPRRNIPIIAVLRGDGANGKTALMRTLTSLLGKRQVHGGRVEELDKNRFVMGNLLGKLLFVDDDVRAGARLPDGTLKTISEAKEVTAELKFKEHFNFVVRTVPVLLCNNIPSLADLSYGMRRRLMVMPFDRKFTETERDPDLFDRICTEELSGVLNRALEGYQRVGQRGARFNPPTPVKKATKVWIEQANPLPAFIETHCAKIPTGRCLVRNLYEAFATWTRAMGYTLTQTQHAMTRNLDHLGYKTKKTNKGVVIIGLVVTAED
jgi:putative DNA primase/helicase